MTVSYNANNPIEVVAWEDTGLILMARVLGKLDLQIQVTRRAAVLACHALSSQTDLLARADAPGDFDLQLAGLFVDAPLCVGHRHAHAEQALGALIGGLQVDGQPGVLVLTGPGLAGRTAP